MSGAYKNISSPLFRPHEGRGLDRMDKTVTSMCKATSWRAYQADINNTIQHQNRVALLSFEMATRLGLSNQARSILYSAAQYHDIGKLKLMPSTIFKNGHLSSQEFENVKKHAINSYKILSHAKGLAHASSIAVIALQHHERLDGSGYPFGLQDHRITPEAKILAVADVYDALTNKRCYKSAMNNETALAILGQGIKSKFDPDVLGVLEAVVTQPIAYRIEKAFPLRPSQDTSRPSLVATNTLTFH